MASWHNVDSAREEWVDAPDEDDVLDDLLSMARDAVEAYAPALTDPENNIPAGYKIGQLMQARNVWSATQADSAGDLGEGAFVIQPRPLDWVIRQMLRPKRGVPVIA